MPILGDVHEVLMEKAETKRLANILNRMVHGSASSFNQQTNVDLSNKYVVLDISELSGVNQTLIFMCNSLSVIGDDQCLV